jgi:hypothetical protein
VKFGNFTTDECAEMRWKLRTFVVWNFYTTLSRSGDFESTKALQDEQRLPFYRSQTPATLQALE